MLRMSYTRGHFWSRTVAPKKGPRAVANGVTGKVRWWNVSPFSIGAGTLGIFMFPHTEIWRIDIQHVIELHLENCLQTFIDMTCRLVLEWVTRFWDLSVPFGYTLHMSVLRNARFEYACMRCEPGPAERSVRVPGVSSSGVGDPLLGEVCRDYRPLASARSIGQPLPSLCFPLLDTVIIWATDSVPHYNDWSVSLGPCSNLGKGRNISSRHPHHVSSVYTGALVPGLKRPDCEADDSI